LSSLMRTRENFPVGHPSQIAPSQARLTWRFFRDMLPKKKMYLVGMVTLLILLRLGPGHPILGARMPNSAQSSPARSCTCPRRLIGGLHLSAPVPWPTHSLPTPLPGGAGMSASVAFARAPAFSLYPASPPRQRNESFPPCACPLSLCRGASLSAPPSPRIVVDQRARMPRIPATSHAPAP
jgi:hypothetical protein